MNEDEKHEAYHRGFEAGKEHSSPSPVTKEFMAKIEEQVKHINKKLDRMPTRDEMVIANKELIDMVFKEADKRYTYRWEFNNVKYITYAMAVLFLGVLLGAGIVVFLGTEFPIYQV